MCARGVEERNTMRTSGESEAETAPYKPRHDLHQVQVLACGGNGLASDASYFSSFLISDNAQIMPTKDTTEIPMNR